MAARRPSWYGSGRSSGVPYLRELEIEGRLIVIEGPDASGRSSQVEMLTEKLEADGHAVLNTGIRRSELVSRGILEAKRNVTLGKRTLAIFYAADFADQLEHKIIPALQSGHVVLADRYVYTLMARNTVRGMSRKWSDDLYGFAMVPDLVFYLDVDPYNLVHRVFEKRQSLDYYESGADIGTYGDVFKSFIAYQQRLAREFEHLKVKYGLKGVDGNRPIEEVHADLEGQISRYLARAQQL